jgi:hypothetical protein
MSETTGTGQVSTRDLRVSDAERDHVVGLLQKAIGRGLLDLDEFTSRTDTAYAARTRGELNAVLVDLPGMVHAEAPRQAAQPRRPSAPNPRDVEPSADRLELNGKYSDIKRSGRWEVPSQIAIANKYGQTKLDFTEAYIAHEVVEIIAASKWGSIELVVPPQASVSTDGISEFKFGSVNDKRKSAPLHGNPHFAVYGSLHGGSLSIRNSRWM